MWPVRQKFLGPVRQAQHDLPNCIFEKKTVNIVYFKVRTVTFVFTITGGNIELEPFIMYLNTLDLICRIYSFGTAASYHYDFEINQYFESSKNYV